MTVWLILAMAGVALIGAISAKYLGNDNAVEEVAESVIEKEMGLKVDLSPLSEEETHPKAQAVDLVIKEF
jgi:predicted ATP-grasp superfamily ATP-dependent carboligase